MARVIKVPETAAMRSLAACWFNYDHVMNNILNNTPYVSTTPTVSTIAAPGNGCIGGAMALNGWIYFFGNSIFKVNPSTHQTVVVSSSGFGCWGPISAPDGYIYCIPANGVDKVLKLDPQTDTYTKVGSTLPSRRYWGTRLGSDNCIYCPPERDGQRWFKLDLKTLTYSYVGSTASNDEDTVCMGAVNAPNKCMFGMSFDQNTLGYWIDTSNNSSYGSYNTDIVTDNFKYRSGALGIDGYVYCAPYEVSYFETINPNTKVSTAHSMSYTQYNYCGGVLGADGAVYFIPFQGTKVARIAPHSILFQTSYISSSNGYMGGVLAPNGKIYCAPNTASTILVIDTKVSTAPCWLTSPYINSGF